MTDRTWGTPVTAADINDHKAPAPDIFTGLGGTYETMVDGSPQLILPGTIPPKNETGDAG